MHEHIGTLDAHSKVLAFSAFKQTLFFVFGVAPHGQLKISLPYYWEISFLNSRKQHVFANIWF